MKSGKKRIRMVLKIAVIVGIVLGVALVAVNAYVKSVTSKKIITVEEAKELTEVDCILVLGCMVWGENSPSPMLRDRLDCGIELYNQNVSPKLLMSGDHGRVDYNEVGTMKNYAMCENVPSEDIFMDHAGFSTYESIYRAKEIFGADKIIIVTQGYHLYRALYIAEQLGVEAYGVAADYNTYAGQSSRDIREALARVKDFGYCLWKPEPTYLGETISIVGNGDVTNDY